MTRGLSHPGSTVGRPLNREIHLAGDILSGLAPAPRIVSSIMVMSWGTPFTYRVALSPEIRISRLPHERLIAFFHRTRPYLIFLYPVYISIPDSLALPGDTPDILIPYPAGSLTAMSFLPPGRMMPPLKTAFQSSCPREAGLIPAFLIRSRREVASVSTPCRLRTARPYPQESSRSPLAVCITAGSAIPVRFSGWRRVCPSVPLCRFPGRSPAFGGDSGKR